MGNKTIVYYLAVDGVMFECYSRETLLQWITFALENGKTVTNITSEGLKS